MFDRHDALNMPSHTFRGLTRGESKSVFHLRHITLSDVSRVGNLHLCGGVVTYMVMLIHLLESHFLLANK
jgi:hypothetical protein